jgi:hypothetical protein
MPISPWQIYLTVWPTHPRHLSRDAVFHLSPTGAPVLKRSPHPPWDDERLRFPIRRHIPPTDLTRGFTVPPRNSGKTHHHVPTPVNSPLVVDLPRPASASVSLRDYTRAATFLHTSPIQPQTCADRATSHPQTHHQHHAPITAKPPHRQGCRIARGSRPLACHSLSDCGICSAGGTDGNSAARWWGDLGLGW